jgi:hypothetical protein
MPTSDADPAEQVLVGLGLALLAPRRSTGARASKYDKKSTNELKFRNVCQMDRLFGSIIGS